MKRINRVGTLLQGALAVSLVVVATCASAGFYRLDEIKPMWVKMDLNHDGYVSRDEIRAQDPGMLKRFRHADFNRDGKLDLREFEVLLISL